MDSPAIVSYGLGLAAFVFFAVQLTLGWRGGLRASLLLGTVAVSALWQGTGLLFSVSESQGAWLAYRLFDALRIGGWFAFIFSITFREDAKVLRSSGERVLPPVWPATLVGVFLLAGVVFPFEAPGSVVPGGEPNRLAPAGWLATAVMGLAALEQLFRRAPEDARWHIKPLCVGLGTGFVFDLYMFSDALLFGRLDASVWSARGVVQALAIPFAALATARSKDWTIDIAFSRGVVFHSTALAGAGLYLLTVAAAGYYVRYLGGTWGKTLQVGLLFAALLLLAYLFLSGTFRSRLRVFINKHFFSYRYDYREEWLRISKILSGEESGNTGIDERCVRALANLVESPGGALWLRNDREVFSQVAQWNLAQVKDPEPADASLPAFLSRTGWVVDLKQLAADPARYPELRVPDWLSNLNQAWLVVPLTHGDRLIGFVVLATSRAPMEINWEIRDALKVAARQASSFIGFTRATEALAETRQFDAFNRMSAFVVHDLKNLVAQLSLTLKNAEKHHGNPEFQADMLATIQHAVGRMNGLLLQLRAGAAPLEKPHPVDLKSVVERVVEAKSAQRAGIAVEAAPQVLAIGHSERLERVLGHLLQNAIDATTAADGRISVRVYHDTGQAVFEVSDNGVGMSPDFVRNELFKPFRTTKPTGTGIGAYESAQYVAELGGRIQVDSGQGSGTRVKVILPAQAGSDSSRGADREVA